jgi:hypothetical protein
MGAVKEQYEGKFTGTSEDGDFQEALKNAIAAAHAASGGADKIIKWKLDDVTGENGGLITIDKLYVTIQALGPETSRS